MRGGEGGMKSLDGSEDEVAQVSKGEGVLHVCRAKEEVNADTLDQEVEGFAHVIDKWHCDVEVAGDGREVWDGVEA